MAPTVARPRAEQTVPAQRRAPRQHAATAAVQAALTESGCILVDTTATTTGCTVSFYDARSLGRAVEVIAAAAVRAGDTGLADRARQAGPGAWTVTAHPQAWEGPEGDPRAAGSRSSTTWRLGIPLADLVPTASALLV
ncbi:hypothetical protein [Kineococcus terrestris]|uniref:hypothetical protein n=1 Tax=Kineococcus terrestris TaxID=2044856 RepID=UPI0034DAF8D9